MHSQWRSQMLLLQFDDDNLTTFWIHVLFEIFNWCHLFLIPKWPHNDITLIFMINSQNSNLYVFHLKGIFRICFKKSLLDRKLIKKNFLRLSINFFKIQNGCFLASCLSKLLDRKQANHWMKFTPHHKSGPIFMKCMLKCEIWLTFYCFFLLIWVHGTSVLYIYIL